MIQNRHGYVKFYSILYESLKLNWKGYVSEIQSQLFEAPYIKKKNPKKSNMESHNS